MSSDKPAPTRGSSNVPNIGRGAVSNLVGRFESTNVEAQDDGWGILEEPLPGLITTVGIDTSRSIIARNNSPDIPFTQSINPYRGCEHGCVYCYARPAHAYLNLSPGLDFETKLFYKPDAVKLLKEELAAKNYQCSPIALGANTDPWQPIEREYKVTRGILETLSECNHPATIVTKGAAIIERDIELLASMAQRNLVGVMISVTTLDKDLKRKLEPRAASPASRLAIIRKLAEAKVPVGAKWASYVMLRLPHEINPLFQEWLQTHEPLKAEHVMSRMRELRGGKDYDSTFGKRQKGEGVFAELFKQRFELACRKFGLNREREWRLDTSKFQPPVLQGRQMGLF
jgi:DNA repair photolyase